jgi:hypothetical protein
MHNTTNTGNTQIYTMEDNIEDTFVININPPLIETTPITQKTRTVLTSVLTKRTYANAFAVGDNATYDGYDDARYGQHIAGNFFTNNYGHAVYYPQKIQTNIPSTNIPQTEADKPFISEEMKFYIENRNLFNV